MSSSPPAPRAERRRPDVLHALKDTTAAIVALQHLTRDFSEHMMPSWIAFTATSHCNLRCPHCQTHGTEETRKIFNARAWPEELVTRLASESLPSAREFCLSLSGEPLATPSLRRRLKEFSRFGARLHLTTNGTLLSNATLVRLLPIAQTIGISIDGATKDVCEAIRLGAEFGKLITNIRTLTRARERLPGWSTPQISLEFTVMTSNVREMPHVVRLARVLGIGLVRFYEVFVFFPNLEDEDLRRIKPLYNAYHDRALAEAARLGVEVHLPAPFPDVAADPDMSFEGRKLIVPSLPADYYQTLPDPTTYLDLDAIEEAATDVAAAILREEEDGVEEGEEAPWPAAERPEQALARAQGILASLLQRHEAQLVEQRRDPDAPVPYCAYLVERTFVTADGDVAPCCLPGRPTLGNIHDGSLGEIYNGSSYTRFRRDFYTDNPPPVCRGCRYSGTVPRRQLLDRIDCALLPRDTTRTAQGQGWTRSPPAPLPTGSGSNE